MVIYTCPTCFKEFNRKCNFIDHTENKKKPCKPNSSKNHTEPQKPTQFHTNSTQFHTTSTQDILISSKNDLDNEKDNIIITQKNELEDNLSPTKINHSCGYCGLVFTRKDALKRHTDKYCKVKILDNEHKEKTFELLIKDNKEKDKEIKDIKNQLEKLQKQIETQLNKAHTQNINKGNITNNNIIIPQSMLTDFGKEDYEKINVKRILNSVKKSGVDGIISCFNDIHYNDETPQYKNVFITDKSRDKAMIYEGGQWKVKPIKKIVADLITHIERYHRVIESRVRKGIYKDMIDPDDPTKKNKINCKELKKDIESRLKKYILRYYGDDPDSTPKDSKNFYEMVLKHLSNHLFDIKDKVYNNYEKLLEDINKDQLDPEIKEIKEEKKQIIKELEKLTKEDLEDDSDDSDSDSDDSDNEEEVEEDKVEEDEYEYKEVTLDTGLKKMKWIKKNQDYKDSFDF